MEPTHASFFSGVGGLDLGLERAGWRTVSFSEIDPYASAVLAERWPGVPNLGDIVQVAGADQPLRAGRWAESDAGSRSGSEREQCAADWTEAVLWSGGFPCQDLSVAGKRAGFGLQQHGRESEHGLRPAESSSEGGERAGDSVGTSGADRGVAAGGTRSGLAFAFLDLVERHRPPAILLENVPGLLSSHRGRDFAALLDRLGQLGYWWAYRILDAQFFGVPQRRRRVFIVALNAERGFGPDSAAAVLSVGARCGGHSAAGDEARTGVATGTGDGVELAGSLTRRYGKGINTTLDDGAAVIGNAVRAGGHGDPGIGRDGDEWRLTLSPPPDPGGVRAPDGLAGGVDDRPLAVSENQRGEVLLTEISHQLTSGGGKPGQGYPAVLSYRKSARPTEADGIESWVDDGLANTLNAFDTGDIRSTHIALGGGPADDPLLPLGLDSHRYRCCGNGVVSSVSEWIGVRLLTALQVPAATPATPVAGEPE